MEKTYLLAVLLLLPFTGCLEDEPEKEEVTGNCQEDMIIEYNDYKVCQFEIDFKQTVEIKWWIDLPEAESTEELDIYFIDEENIDDYREGRDWWSGECEEFVYKEEVSREYVHNETLQRQVELLAGTWYFIIDNTDCTGAQPYDDVRVDYYMVIGYQRYTEE